MHSPILEAPSLPISPSASPPAHPIAQDFAPRHFRSDSHAVAEDDEDEYSTDHNLLSLDHHETQSVATTGGGIGMMGMMSGGMQGGFATRNIFDFGMLEEWGKDEKVALGLNGASASAGVGATGPKGGPAVERTRTMESRQDGEMLVGSFGDLEAGTGGNAGDEEHHFIRRRQRKLSQSNSGPMARRQGKLALFEGGGAAASIASPTPPNGKIQQAVPFHLGSNRPSLDFSSANADKFPAPTNSAAAGAERPYRFSFYSNALPATIHARSLSELPAEGQTFEELFRGEGAESSSEGGTAGGKDHSGLKNNGEETTWWLDVLCPTDEEMRMLSRVKSYMSFFYL